MFGFFREDRVRRHTPEEVNARIDRKIFREMATYKGKPKDSISEKIEELTQRWDMERTLEANAASLALAGLLLGAFFSRKWLVLPMVVAGFLLQHAIQGWCPPIEVFRRLGVRTRPELDWQICELKGLRGDFGKRRLGRKNRGFLPQLRQAERRRETTT